MLLFAAVVVVVVAVVVVRCVAGRAAVAQESATEADHSLLAEEKIREREERG